MIILAKNFAKNNFKILTQNNDDLWYLSHIIDLEDTITAKTFRKIKIETKNESKARVERKPVMLTIKVTKVSFSKSTNNLRLLGTITDGPPDVSLGEHHTIEVDTNTELTINKNKLLSYQKDKLEQATQNETTQNLILIIDRDQALFAILKKYGYQKITTLKGQVQKKQLQETQSTDFFNIALKQLTEYVERYKIKNIIVGGPNFWLGEIKKRSANNKNMIYCVLNGSGEDGLKELLKRNELKTVLQKEKASQELTLVEELLTTISKNEKLASYGIESTIQAANASAIKKLLITDKFIQRARESTQYEKVDKLLFEVDQNNAEIHIISSEHEGGAKLDGLGGLGALLRFEML
ncbi:mRNA surveillance protein pelota [Candidatus Woesearchaeota archaeon]|nr:mRNA surveillance protein pelota [Candidatus Woesearchaeota archaeon]